MKGKKGETAITAPSWETIILVFALMTLVIVIGIYFYIKRSGIHLIDLLPLP